tara:strand:- start:652 stop:1527 length:876 start_codon:yes stop_codon:yes gene_type:complete
MIFIIILNWQSPTDSIRSVRSFLSCGIEPGQIILVDNASADDSVEQFGRTLPDIKVLVSEKNLGYAGGNNLGIRYAMKCGAEFILIANNDTVLVNPDFLKSAEQLMREYPKIGLLGPKVVWPSGEIQRTILSYPSLGQTLLNTVNRWRRRRSGNYDKAGTVKAVSGVCFLARASMLKEVGLMDESYFMYAEEQDFCFRVRRAGWDIRYEPLDSIIHYHMESDPTPERRARKYYYSRRNRVLFCWKNRMPFQAAIMATGLFISFLIKNIIATLRKNTAEISCIWGYILRRYP